MFGLVEILVERVGWMNRVIGLSRILASPSEDDVFASRMLFLELCYIICFAVNDYPTVLVMVVFRYLLTPQLLRPRRLFLGVIHSGIRCLCDTRLDRSDVDL